MAHPMTTNDMQGALEIEYARIDESELDDLLRAIQEDVEDLWSEFMDLIQSGKIEVVEETEDELVLSDQTGKFWQREFDALANYVPLIDSEAEGTEDVIVAAHHNAAYRITDYNWSTSNPVVITKPTGFNAGLVFVESLINGLISRSLSPGQAWAYYGVEVRGNTRNEWAQRGGYSDHSAVSEAVRKAKEKLAV